MKILVSKPKIENNTDDNSHTVLPDRRDSWISNLTLLAGELNVTLPPPSEYSNFNDEGELVLYFNGNSTSKHIQQAIDETFIKSNYLEGMLKAEVEIMVFN